MFDELKEVMHFKEITDFKSLIVSKYVMPFCLKAPSKVWCNFWQLNPFKNDENAFYFTLKAFFVLKIFKFLF